MRKIVLSQQAANKMEKLLQYLETEWSEKTKQNFLNKFDQSVRFVSLYPEATEKSQLKVGLHRCVVTKQTTFYYLFDDTEIRIVAIIDTRMNPEWLKRI